MNQYSFGLIDGRELMVAFATKDECKFGGIDPFTQGGYYVKDGTPQCAENAQRFRDAMISILTAGKEQNLSDSDIESQLIAIHGHIAYYRAIPQVKEFVESKMSENGSCVMICTWYKDNDLVNTDRLFT